MNTLDRYKGCLLGLAVGDALGVAVEFCSPGTFEPITDMIGGGSFDLLPGQWTDDTSMALCLAESLIKCKGFSLEDQLNRYLRWYRDGHLSSTGRCFDIGNTVRAALINFEKTGNPYSGLKSEYSAANGSIMRLAPVPLFYAMSPVEAIEKSGESSKTTHGLKICIDACRYFGGLIAGLVSGATKEEVLSACFRPDNKKWTEKELHPEIYEIASGSYKQKEPPQIKGSGYVVKSLEAALWSFYKSDSFEQGCLLAVNLGDDADTTGAVYGQLAGAWYGMQAIPERWLEKLAYRELIEDFAEKIYLLRSKS